LRCERESVRRAATCGLIAVGAGATSVFLEVITSPVKWLRKAGVYGLGDVSPLSETVMNAVIARLENDPSVYVRSVAAGTLGCLGRRAISTGVGNELIPALLNALTESLSREGNRLCMSRAQKRSIKFVRPTDDCDVCEGNGIDFGLERFEPVRSAVRENALWSIVILCSHGAGILGSSFERTVTALNRVVREDKNVICVGFAMDALNRLASLRPEDKNQAQVSALRTSLPAIFEQTPVHSWEALACGGLDVETLSEEMKEILRRR
jgi:hypothetical protein